MRFFLQLAGLSSEKSLRQCKQKYCLEKKNEFYAKANIGITMTVKQWGFIATTVIFKVFWEIKIILQHLYKVQNMIRFLLVRDTTISVGFKYFNPNSKLEGTKSQHKSGPEGISTELQS
jgi:hypothetical protein